MSILLIILICFLYAWMSAFLAFGSSPENLLPALVLAFWPILIVVLMFMLLFELAVCLIGGEK